jgi:TonB family protein
LKFILALISCVAFSGGNPGRVLAQVQPQAQPPDTTTLPAGPLVGFNAIAHVLAMELAQAGHKKIVVMDFCGPDRNWTPFAGWLADQFSLAFNEVGYPLKVADRAEIKSNCEARFTGQKDQPGLDKEKIRAAQSLGADAIVQGTYRAAEKGFGITAMVYSVARPDDETSTTPVSVKPVIGKLLVGNEINSHLLQSLDAITGDNSIALSGEGGVGYPSCIYCPHPQYSGEASIKRIQGTVLTLVTISSDGRATHIEVTTKLGYGLDEAAVEAVKNWKFKPATDVDGKPVPVRVPIEVTFRLY